MPWGEASGPTPEARRRRRLERAAAQLVAALDEWEARPTTGQAEVVKAWRDTVRGELTADHSPARA